MLDLSANPNGPYLATKKCKLINRCGEPIAPGSLVAFNVSLENVSGQTMAGLNPSDNRDPTLDSTTAGYILGGACKPTTQNIKWDMAVVDDTPDGSNVADNAEFTAILVSQDVKILLEPSSGIAAGEMFVGTNNQYYGTGRTTVELGTVTTIGAASVLRVIGQAMEAGSTTSTATRKRCRFWGGAFPLGFYVSAGAS